MTNQPSAEEWHKELWKYRNSGLDPYMIPSLERFIESLLSQSRAKGKAEGVRETIIKLDQWTRERMGYYDKPRKVNKIWSQGYDTALSDLLNYFNSLPEGK